MTKIKGITLYSVDELDRMSEDQLQARIILWWDGACARYGAEPSDLTHIPNGLMSTQSRKKCGALGVRKGYPDLFLALPRGVYGGLFIELKRPSVQVKSGLSRDQVRILRRLEDVGYAVYATNNFEEVTEIIANYMELEK